MASVRSKTRENSSRIDRMVKSALRRVSPSRGLIAANVEEGDPMVRIKYDSKGPLGLELLYEPPNPQIDFIFAHGLGGGSRKTWSSSKDARQFWPKAWLSEDEKFASVRIHSFGYDADWHKWRTSPMNILDFARSLLGEMTCEKIAKSNTKIVLIGHSMGGIIIKKAYMLAREDSQLKKFANRVHTLFFLATPHRGSDYSQFLANLLAISYGEKPYVAEISRNSESIRLINDSFSHCAAELQLWSFYEQIPTRIAPFSTIIVDVSSATLEFDHEVRLPLHADHRGICKFQDKNDSNYKTLREKFIITIDRICSDTSTSSSHSRMQEYEQLDRLTGISVISEDSFSTLKSTRALGSCEWFITKPSFTAWKGKEPGVHAVFWLTGNVGSGKSYLTSRVITKLQHHNPLCSYFFFKKGSSPESSIITCLRSLANQMARSDDTILRRLLEMQEKSSWGNWDNWDDQTMWRKLFLECIFKDPMPQNHFWVIDAVDKCQKSQSFLNLLMNAPPELRIFFNSRSDLGAEKRCGCLKKSVEHYEIQIEDTVGDLKIFIHHRLENVSAINDHGREHFEQKILEKASGSFLWVSLVMARLEEAFSEEQAEEILNEVPTDMGDFYGEMLGNLLQNRHAIALARSLYMWTLLSLRPLEVAVLQCALKLDTQQTVHNLEKLVPVISGRLVFVNKKQEVEVIHETAKSYLLQQKTHPELALCNPKCHTQIARICLTLLAGDFTKLQQSQVPKRPSIPSTSVIVPNFADYVCEYFSDHLQKSLSEDNHNWDLLCKFLDCNLLVWIEFLAKKGRVRSVTRTAQNLQAYFRRRLKYLSPISPQKAAMDAWICDIFKLNAKFGTSLALSPSSIRHLIPSMCPSESMVAKYLNLLAQDTGFNIKGLTDGAWDDCLARIDYIDYQVSAITCGERYSAVALSDGSIQLYFPDSVQVHATLNHGGRVTVLSFSNEDQYLASSGSRKVKIWNPSKGGLLWAVDISHQILALFFIENEFTLAGATQGNYVVNWDLHDGQEISRWQWTDSIRSTTGAKNTWPQPSRAVFSPKHSLLAVSYRGLPLHLFEINNQRFLGLFNRDCGAALTVTVNHYIIEAFAFNPSPEINILLASYGDGELVVYGVDSKQPLNRMKDVFAQCLKCSPDGRTLVTGSSRGTLQIFEFAGAKGERLLPLYTINAYDDGIRDLAFSSDSLRFADIRGSQYRVWEPAVLAHTEIDEGSQSELSHAASVETRSVGMLEGPLDPEITAMYCHPSGSFVFCGTKDGSVCYFETSTAIKRHVLYRHASNIGITCIQFIEKSHLLVTADESGRVLINNIAVSDTGYEFICCAAEIRSDQSLSKLLQDISGAKILLRGKGTAEIWTVTGQRVGEILSGDYADAQFINHPLHPDYFVSIGLQGLRIFSWADGLDAEQFRGGQSVDFKITPPTPTAHCFSGEQTSISCDEPWNPPFLVMLFEQGSKKSLHGGSSLDIWPASSLTTSASLPPTIPLGKFSRYTHRIRQIITMVESMLFFLDNDFWICSIDVYNLSTISSGARRHFFLLSEWQSIYGGFIIEYISLTRQFVVAKKHELLVISRGLEFEEPWIVQAHVS